MAGCKDGSTADLCAAFPFEHDGEDRGASSQVLAVELDLLVHLASAFSLDRDNSLEALRVSASFLVGPFGAALAFGHHQDLIE